VQAATVAGHSFDLRAGSARLLAAVATTAVAVVAEWQMAFEACTAIVVVAIRAV